MTPAVRVRVRRRPGRPPHRPLCRPPHRRRRDDKGAAALEFALVSLLLVSLLFMIFGTAWALWEYQAARATAREAARLASVGIPDATAYRRGVLCLGDRNGLARGATTQLRVTFYADPTKVGTEPLAVPATTGSYVDVELTYLSSVRGVPFFSEVFRANPGGLFRSSSVARVEQVAPTGVVTGQTWSTATETCS